MTEAHEIPADPLEQAADWQLRLAEDPTAHDEFQRWLGQSPDNARAWEQMQRLWGALGELPAATAAPSPAVATPVRPRATRRRRWPAVAAACALLVLGVLLQPLASLHWRADYLTGIGETREVQLEDGSRVLLGPDSALRTRFGNSRRAELLRGQAFFQIAPDAQHPFITRAGDLSVRVLGTAFDLQRNEGSAEVALQHGSVLAESIDASDSLKLSEQLKPGDRLRLDWAHGEVSRSRLDPARIAAWRDGSLFVENLPVAEIVDQLRRVTPGWIVIADSSLAQRRLSGVFDLRDPDRALNALAQSLAVDSRRLTPWLRTLGSP